MKNVFNGLIIRLDTTEQTISELDEKLREIINIEIHRIKTEFKSCGSVPNTLKCM